MIIIGKLVRNREEADVEDSIPFRSCELITAETLSRYQDTAAEIRIGYKHFDSISLPLSYVNLLRMKMHT